MEKTKTYPRTRFSADALAKAVREFRSAVPNGQDARFIKLSVGLADATWDHDSEVEFLADYRLSNRGARFILYAGSVPNCQMSVHAANTANSGDTTVSVKALDRPEIERVFLVFEEHAEASRLPEPPAPAIKVFIGHGRSQLWRDLKDHLQDQHGYEVVAYEIGSRAGHAVRDVLDEMLSKSTMAFLVMTGEDATDDNQMRSRQNVVHELGLFQGKLGFSRGIAVVERGIELFSNIEGITQIRFDKGNIRETFGDVLATLKREAP